MARPCFLVIDKQYPGNISARKLVIETALLNVITAYSAEESIETLTRFPRIDGIVLDTEIYGMTCRQLIDRLRAIRSDIPIITVSPSGYEPCGGEQYHVSSYDPQQLLEQIRQLCNKEVDKASHEHDNPAGSGGTNLKPD
jgi:CheY-like chemotaxis protein